MENNVELVVHLEGAVEEVGDVSGGTPGVEDRSDGTVQLIYGEEVILRVAETL